MIDLTWQVTSADRDEVGVIEQPENEILPGTEGRVGRGSTGRG